MLLQPFIRTHLTILFFLVFVPLSSLADTTKTDYIQSPYHKQYCSWFEFDEFQRGFEEDSISIVLDSLEKKSKRVWTRMDSLCFAETSLKAGKIDLSRRYFEKLDPDYEDEERFWWAELIIHVLKEEYGAGVDMIRRDHPGILQFTRLYFMQKILFAQLEQSRDSKWYKTNSVFNWPIDSTLSYRKDRQKFEKNVQIPIKNANKVLHFLVHFIHEDDPIIARAFFELGEVIEVYGCEAQAYIAYSLGRQYNRRDKEILNRSKAVKADLLKNMNKVPNFRKYFPRIKKGRFDYEVLKERLKASKIDSSKLKKPLYIVEEEKTIDLPFAIEYVYVIGFGVLFLLMLFLLKVKKK